MKRLDLLQGSPAWLAHRATARNASEAAALLGCHPTMTRTQVLDTRKTGMAKEHSRFIEERVFAGGHRVEAVARAVAEAIIGEDLYPVVGTEVVDGIELSASFDGLNMAEDINWEGKSLNDELRASLPVPGPDGNDPAAIPKYHRVQMEQQCAVSGCARVLFTASDGEDDHRHCWYMPDPALRAEIIAAWRQADIDLETHVPVEASAPVATGRAPETLPALFITVKGEVTESNLANFKEVALAAIRSVNRDLQNDQDFADAEKAVKWCDDIEKRVAGAKQHALSQTATIDTLFKTMDDISAEARQVRLDLEKLVKARKVSLKTEMLTEAQTALGDHIRSLNTRLGRDYMPQVAVDFAGAIAGKRNFDSMRDALNATLANAKIAANSTADKIDANLKVLRAHEADYKFLFNDVAQLVLMENAHLALLVDKRIADHKAAELAKEESTRERIRAEEKAKLEREQAAAAQKVIDDAAAARRDEQNAAGTAAMQGIADARQEESLPAPVLDALEGVATSLIADLAVSRAAATSANVVPMRVAVAPVPPPTTPPTLKLGQIGERLGFALTGDFLKTLGFEPAARDKSALLFHERDFTLICAALVDHIQAVQARQAA